MAGIAAFFEDILKAIVSFNFLSDLLDIVFVTFIIYEIIKLLRGTRAIQLVRGIILLVVVYTLTLVLRMEASSYLFSKLFENAIIIVLILFSPEIRHALESVGRSSLSSLGLFSLKNNEERRERIRSGINAVCKACSDMSSTKTGALIVFENEAPLSDIINTGTLIDAVISNELVGGIFFKNSTLHDGAVIIRDGKLYAAGCILPLTQNQTLGSELGTRHRAALGMSEESDAMVVVVSEETGTISIARAGELLRDVPVANLREVLVEYLLGNDDGNNGAGDRIKKIVRRNKGEKE
ncbi:MAG: TIGR00159 family protein [Clostridiales bacterium]|nr:TIGR00159 family protein [Clostridiales bacterium]